MAVPDGALLHLPLRRYAWQSRVVLSQSAALSHRQLGDGPAPHGRAPARSWLRQRGCWEALSPKNLISKNVINRVKM